MVQEKRVIKHLNNYEALRQEGGKTMAGMFGCSKCNGIVRFDGGYCENCGANISYKQPVLNKKPTSFNNPKDNETTVEYKALRHEVELIRKEIMIAFKRLVNIENRIEAIEKN